MSVLKRLQTVMKRFGMLEVCDDDGTRSRSRNRTKYSILKLLFTKCYFLGNAFVRFLKINIIFFKALTKFADFTLHQIFEIFEKINIVIYF
jgi:hypothetical protein